MFRVQGCGLGQPLGTQKLLPQQQQQQVQREQEQLLLQMSDAAAAAHAVHVCSSGSLAMTTHGTHIRYSRMWVAW